jgi:hypothetical protein
MRTSCIPPITSTGSNRRRTPARLDGLAHVSIGRFMSEMERNRKTEDDNETWSVTKYARSDFNQKSKKEETTPYIYDTEQKINCITHTFDDYNEEGDFVITLEFSGFEFSGDTFNRIDFHNNTCCYFIPVRFQGKEACLYLTTIGDIFEYEVVSYKGSVTRFFSDEDFIPELLQTYDSSSMRVELAGNYIIITYKKNQIYGR